MNTLFTLVKREYWENRGSFYRAPVAFGGLVLLMALCSFIMIATGFSHHIIGTDIHAFDKIPSSLTAYLFSMISLPFMIILWLVIFNYFLGCLYDDRKDRSLLFWESMPISVTETILSKALAGIILAPLCTWFCIIVTEFIFLIILSITALTLGGIPVSALWSPTAIIGAWLNILETLTLQALWLFPLVGWSMLCSAYAKKSAFLTAVVPVFILIIIEIIFSRFSHAHVGGYVFSRFAHAFSSWKTLVIAHDVNPHINVGQSYSVQALNHFNSSYGSLYLGLLIGGIFMCAAGYLRHICFRTDD